MLNSPGWVFLDKDDVEVFKRLSLTSESEETVDQLGFGVLNREISNTLFPWCSTLTTRARYFLFSAAIINMALQRVSAEGRNQNPSGGIANAKLRDFVRQFQDEVKRLERILALSLYSQYRQAGAFGIFGKRNLTRFEERPLGTVLAKRLLSEDARYPNAIYRGGLTQLGFYIQNESSNLLAMKLALHDESCLAPEWLHAIQAAESEIKRLEHFWGDRALRSMAFPQACERFIKFQQTHGFNGFDLQKAEKALLKEKILKATPYLEPVFDKQATFFESGRLNLKRLAEAVPISEAQKISAALMVDSMTSVFQELYAHIGSHREDLARRKAISLPKLKASYHYLRSSKAYQHLSDACATVGPWLSVLERADGKVTSYLIELLKQRAEQVVHSRGKKAPHELMHKKADHKEISEELDIDNTGFRLGRASIILSDLIRGSRGSRD
jgi:hypothetical protein